MGRGEGRFSEAGSDPTWRRLKPPRDDRVMTAEPAGESGGLKSVRKSLWKSGFPVPPGRPRRAIRRTIRRAIRRRCAGTGERPGTGKPPHAGSGGRRQATDVPRAAASSGNRWLHRRYSADREPPATPVRSGGRRHAPCQPLPGPVTGPAPPWPRSSPDACDESALPAQRRGEDSGAKARRRGPGAKIQRRSLSTRRRCRGNPSGYVAPCGAGA